MLNEPKPAAFNTLESAPENPKQAHNRTVEYSRDYLAEIVGEENRIGERMQAGPILKLMYDTAVAVSFRHGGVRPVMYRMDRLDLVRMICHMDMVRMEGRVIEASHSSMVVEVRCYVKPPMERELSPSHVGYFTMVGINDQGMPVREIPPLDLDSPSGQEAATLASHRQAQLNERLKALEWIDETNPLRAEDVIEADHVQRYDLLAPEQTVLRLKGQLISSGNTQDRRVLAGDLLVWLDRVATYTARQFTRNDLAVTLSVNDVVFRKPLHATDRIELVSRVVYVRTHTLEVSIDITVHTLEGEQYNIDSVQFFILNYHPNGTKQKITTGLELNPEDQDALRRYLKARTRFDFWKSNPESHLSQSLD